MPIALPPTVNPAANADIIREIPLGHPTCALAKINAAIVADAEPDTTPQMSPTTSLQIELTRSALRRRRMKNGSLDLDIPEIKILCDKDGKELKRAQVMQNGECTFGEVDKGKYFIKFKNRAPIIENKPQDKAAPYIMELPYVRKK